MMVYDGWVLQIGYGVSYNSLYYLSMDVGRLEVKTYTPVSECRVTRLQLLGHGEG